jgi:hypothetical protein
MANPADWGPPLWKFLHGLAERLERGNIPMILADERKAWIHLLKSLDAVLPCVKCSAHYKQWRIRNPPERLGAIVGLRETSRKWLWSLHNEINQEKGVESPTLDTMKTLYGSLKVYELRDNLDRCIDLFKKAVLLRLVNPTAIQEFKRCASLILRLTD